MQGAGVGGAGCFGVGKADDEHALGVCECAVPIVVVAGGTDAEAAAVDTEDGRECLWRCQVVGGGEEDAASRP